MPRRIFGDLRVFVSYAGDPIDPNEYDYTRAKVKIFRVGEPTAMKRVYYTLTPGAEMDDDLIDVLAFRALCDLVEYCPRMAVVAGPMGALAEQHVAPRVNQPLNQRAGQRVPRTKTAEHRQFIA